jgi:carbonic anhydrase
VPRSFAGVSLLLLAPMSLKSQDHKYGHRIYSGAEGPSHYVQINVGALLPSDLRYYTFPGSLTTPPRTEHVTWIVLEHPVTVSAAEIQRFEKLYRHNARPMESLFDRVVLESK